MNLPNYFFRNHITWLGMMVHLHVEWHRLPRVDIYHQRSNLLKITQITLNQLEKFGRFPGTYKIHLKKDAKPVIHPQQKWPIAM